MSDLIPRYDQSMMAAYGLPVGFDQGRGRYRMGF